jgi:hypothetical protein
VLTDTNAGWVRLGTSDENIDGTSDAQLTPDVFFVRHVDAVHPVLLALGPYQDEPGVRPSESGRDAVDGRTGHGAPPGGCPRYFLGGPAAS